VTARFLGLVQAQPSDPVPLKLTRPRPGGRVAPRAAVTQRAQHCRQMTKAVRARSITPPADSSRSFCTRGNVVPSFRLIPAFQPRLRIVWQRTRYGCFRQWLRGYGPGCCARGLCVVACAFAVASPFPLGPRHLGSSPCRSAPPRCSVTASAAPGRAYRHTCTFDVAGRPTVYAGAVLGQGAWL
jgi:hypothetical protein